LAAQAWFYGPLCTAQNMKASLTWTWNYHPIQHPHPHPHPLLLLEVGCVTLHLVLCGSAASPWGHINMYFVLKVLLDFSFESSASEPVESLAFQSFVH